MKAWGPLVRGMRFRHPKIVALAEKYSKEPAQVLLRYSLQKVRARYFPPIAAAAVLAAICDIVLTVGVSGVCRDPEVRLEA